MIIQSGGRVFATVFLTLVLWRAPSTSTNHMSIDLQLPSGHSLLRIVSRKMFPHLETHKKVPSVSLEAWLAENSVLLARYWVFLRSFPPWSTAYSCLTLSHFPISDLKKQPQNPIIQCYSSSKMGVSLFSNCSLVSY